MAARMFLCLQQENVLQSYDVNNFQTQYDMLIKATEAPRLKKSVGKYGHEIGSHYTCTVAQHY